MAVSIRDIEHFRSNLLSWYHRAHRRLPWRETKDPYRIWVSEVMLQQTQVATVVPYYTRFLERFPTVAVLAEAPEDAVLKLWEGLGYYARARNLQAAARTVVAAHGGVVPRGLETFLSLKGVGAYIGAAVHSIAFNTPVAVVDGNVKRVIARLLAEAHPVNHAAATARFSPHATNLLDRAAPGDFNQAMMELGAIICTPKKPRCEICPVAEHCQALRADAVAQFPTRLTKKPVPTHRVAVGVIWKRDKVLVTKRKPEGLLGGLWEFPGGKISSDEPPAAACRREISEEVGLDISMIRHLTTVRHAYTHFKIIMEVFECRYRSGAVRLAGPVDFKWIILDQLPTLAFPKANNKFIPLLSAPPKK